MGANAAVLVSLLLGLLDRAAEIGGLIQTAQSAGVDITTAQLDALVAKDGTSRDALIAAIALAKAQAAVKPAAAVTK